MDKGDEIKVGDLFKLYFLVLFIIGKWIILLID